MTLFSMWPRIKAVLRTLRADPASPIAFHALEATASLEAPLPRHAAPVATPPETEAPRPVVKVAELVVGAESSRVMTPIVPQERMGAYFSDRDGWAFDSRYVGRRVKRALIDVTLEDGRYTRVLATGVWDGSGPYQLYYEPIISLRKGPPSKALDGHVPTEDLGVHHG